MLYVYFSNSKNKYFKSLKSINFAKLIQDFKRYFKELFPALRCIFLWLKEPQEGCRYYPGYENEIVKQKYYACIVYYSN